MFLWRKSAEPHWLKAHEDLLEAHADGQLVVIRRLGRKLSQLEIACSSRSQSRALLEQFGGRVEELPRNGSTDLPALAKRSRSRLESAWSSRNP
jgi:hypothetical protein